MTSAPRLLVIDNYDSFVYTIVGYLRQLGAETVVQRNDAVTVDVREVAGVLVSPGPGTPAEAGASIDAVRACRDHAVPMFGVCLGHQVLAEVFGATVSHAPELMHGKTSLVEHAGRGVFAGVPTPVECTRYHSLAVEPETVPDELEVTAWVAGTGTGTGTGAGSDTGGYAGTGTGTGTGTGAGSDTGGYAGAGAGAGTGTGAGSDTGGYAGAGAGTGAGGYAGVDAGAASRAAGADRRGLPVVMGLRHRTLPLEGVQFHPESVLTRGGHLMLGNWLEEVGLPGAAARGAQLAPLVRH